MNWANVVNGVIVQVVEQAERPSIDGNWIDVSGQKVGPGFVTNGESWEPPTQRPETRLTKRSFWNRFPVANERAMRAVIASGTPALLAGTFAQLQSRVDSSPWVDVALEETIQGIRDLVAVAVPATITIDGQVLPLRLSSDQAAAILARPSQKEAYTEVIR